MTNENGLLAKLMRGKTFAIRKSVVFALIGGILIGSGSVLFSSGTTPETFRSHLRLTPR